MLPTWRSKDVRSVWFPGVHFLLFVAAATILLSACNSSAPSGSSASTVAPRGSLELVFPYGSEKEKWIRDVTDTFNRSNTRTASGQRIFVRAVPMGSGESIDEILSSRLQAHLVSPASAVFVQQGNAKSRGATGKDLIGPTDNLVLSPAVIAIWKPMAEAIGWGRKPVGWSDILALARNPKGWASYGY